MWFFSWLPTIDKEYHIQVRKSVDHPWVTTTKYAGWASPKNIQADAAGLQARSFVGGDVFFGYQVRVNRIYVMTWEKSISL